MYLTEEEECRAAGVSTQLLAVYKVQNLRKYRILKLMGIPKYMALTYKLRSEVSEIYFELLGKRKLSDFYRCMFTDKYKSKETFIKSISDIVGNCSTNIASVKVILKYRRIIRRYTIYKKHKGY